MGGRGAASGLGKHPYGTEFYTVYQYENIKFVRQTNAKNAKDPMETQTKGRVYAVINDNGDINSIVFYDDNGRRYKAVHLTHRHAGLMGPHYHLGYFHDENGSGLLSPSDEKYVDYVRNLWYNRPRK